MPIDPKDMNQRLLLTKPEDTVRGLIFNAVFRLVEQRAGAKAAAEVKAKSPAKSHVDFFAYPVTDFLRCLYSGADALEPFYPSTNDAIRACGAAVMKDFFGSAVGKTLLTMVGRGDPKRLFSSAPTAYSTAVSYGKREFQSLGDKKVKLIFHGDMQPPAFHEGLLIEAIRAMGCEGTAISTERALAEVEYLIEWH